MHTRILGSIVLLAAIGCGGKGPAFPGGGGGSVNPDGCGAYAETDVGAKLKLFLSAVANLDTRAKETADVVRASCVTMGKELGMSDGDFSSGMLTKDVCAKVWGAYNDNLKVAVKSKAAFKVVYKPAVCTVDVSATAELAAKCEGKASADVGAKCEGTCSGTCEGTCKASGTAGTGGSSGGGNCNGVCEGTCKGSCSGHADVEASAQCEAHAQASASADVKCTEPELTVTLDAALVVDTTKAEQTLKAMQAGFPKLLSIHARMASLQAAVTATASAASELKSAGSDFASAFKDQALCISGQIAAAASAAANIQANVSVSVEVSASASASASGG